MDIFFTRPRCGNYAVKYMFWAEMYCDRPTNRPADYPCMLQINSLPLWDNGNQFQKAFLCSPYRLLSWISHGKLPSYESQNWIGWWFGAARQQAITRADVDKDMCRQTASPGRNELKPLNKSGMYVIKTIVFITQEFLELASDFFQ